MRLPRVRHDLVTKQQQPEQTFFQRLYTDGQKAREKMLNIGKYWCCSVVKSCPTLCDPMDYSMPGFPVFHYLLGFAQTQVHLVGDAI